MRRSSSWLKRSRIVRVGLIAPVLTAFGAAALVEQPANAATLSTWSQTGSLSVPRADATSTTLTNGQVLVAGGNAGTLAAPLPSSVAELFNPTMSTWAITGGSGLSTARYDATSSLLSDGRVLITGGVTSVAGVLTAATTAEIYTPSSGGFSLAAAPPTAVFGASAVTLQNGNVLVVGGNTGSPTTPVASSAAAEYNPTSNTWVNASTMTNARAFATATLLSTGNVLVAGGSATSSVAEIYNATAHTWSTTGALSTNRSNAGAVLLSTGNVLVAGGFNTATTPSAVNTAEVYNTTAGTWSTTGAMTSPRANATLTLLPGGTVLESGGNAATQATPTPLATAEIYSATTNAWTATGGLIAPTMDATANIVSGGYVLVAGGYSGSVPQATAQEYLAGAAPAFTSPTTLALTAGVTNTFTITTSGAPAPTITEAGTLPAGVFFVATTTGTATLSGAPTSAAGSFPITLTATNGIGTPVTQTLTITVAKAGNGGYLLAAASGTLYKYGDAVAGTPVSVNAKTRPIVALASNTVGSGYWLVTSIGNVYNENGAPFYGSAAAHPLASPITAFAATPDGKGYWLVAKSGAVYPYGDAVSYSTLAVNAKVRPVVAMTPTPDGKGYWLVTSLGNVYNYGDAKFYGSEAAMKLPHPVVGFGVTSDAKGYWLATSGGNIYNIGDAKFFGSKAKVKLPTAVVAFTPTVDSLGYFFVTAGGNVYNYGDSQFYSSPAKTALPSPIRGFAITN